MFLYYTERSPFARKTRMALIHHKLQEEVKLIFTMPTERPAELMTKNPLGKIPVLVSREGQNLIDSPLICQYIDMIGQGRKLIAKNEEKRLQQLQLEALADGIMDAAVLMMLEHWRPQAKRYDVQFEKQTDNILRSLFFLESHIEELRKTLSIAHLAVGAALDYIHHRLPSIGIEHEWLAAVPKLREWYQEFQSHELMQQTLPNEGW